MLEIEREGFSWFNHLFGFKESILDVYKNLVVEETPDKNIITSKLNNKSFNAGKFELRTASSFNLTPRGNGRFHLIKGNGMDSKHLEYVDVLTAQNHDEFEGATFAVASNFNCLELPSINNSPSEGVTNYWGDSTQGPLASITCASALVYRNYFFKHNDCVGQLKKEINLLSKTPLHTKSGKAMIDEQTSNYLKNQNFDWENTDNYYIGVHRNCQVTIARGKNDMYRNFIEVQKPKIVHQVFASTLAFDSYSIRNDFTLSIARNLLYAEYKAIILASWENSLLYPGHSGSNKVFLTLLGGGVFHNPFDIICEAITRNQDIIEKSGLDVYLVCFDKNTSHTIEPYVQNLIKCTNGSIINA